MAKAGRKQRKDIPWDQIKARFMTGDESIRAIAREFGVSDSTVCKKAKSEGWQKSDQINQHIEKRAEIEAERNELMRRESGLPPQIQNEITRQVYTRATWIERFSRLQGTLMDDVMSMWEHDRKVQPVLGEEHDPNRYGKAKIVQEVIEKAKKQMIGDAPLLGEEKEADDGEGYAIVVPEREVKRIEEQRGSNEGNQRVD